MTSQTSLWDSQARDIRNRAKFVPIVSCRKVSKCGHNEVLIWSVLPIGQVGHDTKKVELRHKMQNSRMTQNLLRSLGLMLTFVGSPLAAEIFFENGYPTADAKLGEALQENEQQHAKDLLSVIENEIGAEYYPGTAKRDEHTKSHGCVNAVFQVEDNLPEDLRQGIFEKSESYQAIIRFSNSSPDSQAPDIEKDGRGFAIKIFGVPGESISSEVSAQGQQDFILLSVPYFFINSAKDYTKVIDVKDNGTKLEELELIETIGLKGTRNISEFFSAQIGSPLEQRYYSAVPYRLGDGSKRIAVKYSVKQCDPTSTAIPDDPDRNYLRSVLAETLEKGSSCLEFMVQRKVGDDMNVEDSLTEWSEDLSPYVTVAKIQIPQQVFNTAKQNNACEAMSFNPWHSLPAHKPLGSINRVRYIVYEGISNMRRRMNELEGNGN